MRGMRVRRWRRWRRIVAATVLAVGIAVAAANVHVMAAASGRIVAASAVAHCDAAIVPGARIHADGTPYAMLCDRLEAARSLWQQRRVDRILVSGSGSGDRAEDEVGAMHRWLRARGVPEAAILDDPCGFRTLDTMDRARSVYGIATAVVVSNDFHVARAVFLGQRLGLDVVGVAAPQLQPLAMGTGLRNRGREFVARAAAWFDVFVLGTRGVGCGGR